jgi:hypothetical protein
MTAHRLRGPVVLLLALASTGCMTVVQAPAVTASLGAQLSVERFLQAANEHDVLAMGQLFGTSDGPAMDTGSALGCMFKRIGSWFGGTACQSKQEVEIRMDAIASILEHRDYVVAGESRVAGRTSPTTRILVDMTLDDGSAVRGVPFVVVRTGRGHWLVEQVDLERVMSAR